MATPFPVHRGAIGCCSVSRRCSDSRVVVGSATAGERFGFRVSVPSASKFASSASSSRSGRFQLITRAPQESTPLRWQQRQQGRRDREDYDSLGETVCQSTLTLHLSDIEPSSKWSPFRVLPMAAIVLAFSRAASLMASLRDEVQMRVSGGGTRNAEDGLLVEEFGEAAEGSKPWRAGLEKALVQQGGLSLALLSATAMAQDHLNPIIATLRANPTFMSGLLAWAFAQVAKVFTYYMLVRKWDFRMLMGSGGMPSSHSALCFALTTSVAFVHGVSDALFPVCLGFTLIVMYDAAGVRRHAGRQAEVLNMIVADLFHGHPMSDRKLKELLGHTPLQVFAGAALGIIVGYLCSRSRTM